MKIERESALASGLESRVIHLVSSWQRIMMTALTRPFVLFYNEPIVQVLGIYMAFIYGLYYRECWARILP
jgi:hypothetical protein